MKDYWLYIVKLYFNEDYIIMKTTDYNIIHWYEQI